MTTAQKARWVSVGLCVVWGIFSIAMTKHPDVWSYNAGAAFAVGIMTVFA